MKKLCEEIPLEEKTEGEFLERVFKKKGMVFVKLFEDGILDTVESNCK